MELLLAMSGLAATASIIGAIFAIWRWEYAIRSYKLQRLQVMMQMLMLDESREYWSTGKDEYIREKREHCPHPTLKEIIEEAKKAGLDIV